MFPNRQQILPTQPFQEKDAVNAIVELQKFYLLEFHSVSSSCEFESDKSLNSIFPKLNHINYTLSFEISKIKNTKYSEFSFEHGHWIH